MVPFGKKDDEAPYEKYQQFRKQVETAIVNIKKLPDRKDRLAAYEAVSEQLHAQFGGKPKKLDSKAVTLAAGGGALAGVGATAALAGAFLLPWFSIPALALFGGVAAATGATGAGGIAAFITGAREARKQKKEHGSLENVREIHSIIGLVDTEIETEKASLSSKERDELVSKQAATVTADVLGKIANENKPQPAAEAPVAKTEAVTPSFKKAAAPVVEAAPVDPAVAAAAAEKKKKGFEHITTLSKTLKETKPTPKP